MTNKIFSIGNIDMGEGLPCHLIAEIGLNHNGSVDLAKKMIDAAVLSGSSVVKFQKREPSALATAAFLDAPFPKCPAFGRTQRDVREKLELGLDEYIELKRYAESLGQIFCSSVFDLVSLEFLQKVDIDLIKIASHSLTNAPLLEAIADTGKPVMLSLGGTTWQERDKAVEILKDNQLMLFHCVSAYPTPDSQVKLDTIQAIKDRYGLPVGFSGHETGTALSFAAAALGACAIERHFTLNRAMVGLDHTISLLPDEFASLAMDLKRLHQARGVAEPLQAGEFAARNNYHVSICSSRALKKGQTISDGDIVCKQPLTDAADFFTGMEVDAILGRTMVEDLPADTPIPRAQVK